MPYITETRKRQLQDPGEPYTSAGDLTYALYAAAIEKSSTADFTCNTVRQHIDRYIGRATIFGFPREPSYADYATVLGCLWSCAQELNRQQGKHLQSEVLDYMDILYAAGREYYAEVIAPYEDTKIEQNGDVSHYPRETRACN